MVVLFSRVTVYFYYCFYPMCLGGCRHENGKRKRRTACAQSPLPEAKTAKKDLASMQAKSWVAFVAVMAASLPAYGNSNASISRDLLTVPGSEIRRQDTSSEAGLLFRNAVEDEQANSTGMQPARWGSSINETPREQERIAILPEPGSGFLLGIGLAALIYLRRSHVLVHEN